MWPRGDAGWSISTWRSSSTGWGTTCSWHVVARKVKDRRVLQLIRNYLTAGVLEGGIVSPRVEGTPQGGPISPLLSNILLDEFDKELEKRGHAFCRYADDCNIYVRPGMRERVMASVTRYCRNDSN